MECNSAVRQAIFEPSFGTAGLVAGHFCDQMEWLNEPPVVGGKKAASSTIPLAKNRFWRTTHYGFIRDDGHLRFADVKLPPNCRFWGHMKTTTKPE